MSSETFEVCVDKMIIKVDYLFRIEKNVSNTYIHFKILYSNYRFLILEIFGTHLYKSQF